METSQIATIENNSVMGIVNVLDALNGYKNIRDIRPEQFLDSINTTWLVEKTPEELLQLPLDHMIYRSEFAEGIKYAIKNEGIEVIGWNVDTEIQQCSSN